MAGRLAAAGVGTNESDSTGRQKTQQDAIAALQLLLDRGLDLNAPDNNGRTALHGAALQGYNDVIKFLASKGAAFNAKGKAVSAKRATPSASWSVTADGLVTASFKLDQIDLGTIVGPTVDLAVEVRVGAVKSMKL